MTAQLEAQAVARGVLESLSQDHLLLAIPHTDYRLHLVHTAPIETPVRKRIRGTIHAKALRMHTAQGGGRFIEPVHGAPRIVAGTVLAVDGGSNRLLVDVAVPMWVTMQDGQAATEFAEGQLVNFYVESGTSFTPADAVG